MLKSAAKKFNSDAGGNCHVDRIHWTSGQGRIQHMLQIRPSRFRQTVLMKPGFCNYMIIERPGERIFFSRGSTVSFH